jgi:SAM-dependent methyltransferase
MLTERVNLGEQYFSGYFPVVGESLEQAKAPLILLECLECRLVQLKDTFDFDFMYGENYGYRSGLNSSMVKHLTYKAEGLIGQLKLNNKSRILDIGSNDGTFLRTFAPLDARLYGIDPTISNWQEYYDFEVENHGVLFEESKIESLNLGKFDLISAISMFYDVPDPVAFARLIKRHLNEDGIWHIELSYLPSMLRQKSFDTICHEHLEYYSLESITNIFELAGLKIVDFHFNDTNGGSIALNVTHLESTKFRTSKDLALALITESMEIDEQSWNDFNNNIEEVIEKLSTFVHEHNDQGKNITGLGASTKGNVTLQSVKFDSDVIKSIGEVNPKKFGRVTPGTNIPIKSQEDSDLDNPDFKLVLPWHFKNHIIENQRKFLSNGGNLIFPLPNFEII